MQLLPLLLWQWHLHMLEFFFLSLSVLPLPFLAGGKETPAEASTPAVKVISWLVSFVNSYESEIDLDVKEVVQPESTVA